uniref:Podoplanin n=1 Tax=Peromyscus maniculatus bairdii TaxID=230844 RepID=A0A8C8VSZ6_PERMB
MWTAPVLFWIFGSAWFWHFAPGGAVGGLEDDIVTPGPGDGMETLGLEEGIATTGVTGGLNEPTGKVPLVPTERESRTKFPIEDISTSAIPDRGHEEHKSTTTVKMVTSHSADKETSHPNREGLAVVTLVGIIVGVLLAIGFVGGIIVVVMRKISGRFSP